MFQLGASVSGENLGLEICLKLSLKRQVGRPIEPLGTTGERRGVRISEDVPCVNAWRVEIVQLGQNALSPEL